MRRLVLVLATSLVLPSGAALSVLEDREAEGARTVRVAVEAGDLGARVLAGEAALDGVALDDHWRAIPGTPAPWRGHAATLEVRLTGNGTVALADDASGFLLTVRREPGPQAGEEPPSSAVPAPSADGTEPPGAAPPAHPRGGPEGAPPVPGPSSQAPVGSETTETELPSLATLVLPALLVLAGLLRAVLPRR